MSYETGFRGSGWIQLPESVRKRFWEAVTSGLPPTAAATVAGVSGGTGRRWASQAGYQTDPKHYGIRYSQQVKDVFWEAMRSGMKVTDAAVVAGVSEHRARCWVQQAGYVPRTAVLVDPEAEAGPPAKDMTFLERCQLEDLLEGGYCKAEAAVKLGRDRSTIYREVNRCGPDSVYRAGAAQATVNANRARPKVRKLESHPALLAEVLQRLGQRHSPEQIAGRLRQDFPEDPEMWVSHETIYQAMYVQPRGELARQVKAALRTGRTQRKPQGRKHVEAPERFKGMLNISERPAEADDRAIPGHWEGDLILGEKNASAIGTLVEEPVTNSV